MLRLGLLVLGLAACATVEIGRDFDPAAADVASPKEPTMIAAIYARTEQQNKRRV